MGTAFNELKQQEKAFLRAHMHTVASLDQTKRRLFERAVKQLYLELDTLIRRETRDMGNLGQNHYFCIRSLNDSALRLHDGNQLVGEEFFGLNRFIPQMPDIADIQWWTEFSNGDWRLHDWSPEGEHQLYSRQGYLQRALIYVNGNPLSVDETISLYRTIKNRQKQTVGDIASRREKLESLVDGQHVDTTELEDFNLFDGQLTFTGRSHIHQQKARTRKEAVENLERILMGEKPTDLGTMPFGRTDHIQQLVKKFEIDTILNAESIQKEDIQTFSVFDSYCTQLYGFSAQALMAIGRIGVSDNVYLDAVFEKKPFFAHKRMIIDYDALLQRAKKEVDLEKIAYDVTQNASLGQIATSVTDFAKHAPRKVIRRALEKRISQLSTMSEIITYFTHEQTFDQFVKLRGAQKRRKAQLALNTYAQASVDDKLSYLCEIQKVTKDISEVVDAAYAGITSIDDFVQITKKVQEEFQESGTDATLKHYEAFVNKKSGVERIETIFTLVSEANFILPSEFEGMTRGVFKALVSVEKENHTWFNAYSKIKVKAPDLEGKSPYRNYSGILTPKTAEAVLVDLYHEIDDDIFAKYQRLFDDFELEVKGKTLKIKNKTSYDGVTENIVNTFLFSSYVAARKAGENPDITDKRCRYIDLSDWVPKKQPSIFDGNPFDNPFGNSSQVSTKKKEMLYRPNRTIEDILTQYTPQQFQKSVYSIFDKMQNKDIFTNKKTCISDITKMYNTFK